MNFTSKYNNFIVCHDYIIFEKFHNFYIDSKQKIIFFYVIILRKHINELYESFRRKPGWRFTACVEYGNSWQLVASTKLTDKFVTLRVVLASFSRFQHSIWLRQFFSSTFWCGGCHGVSHIFIWRPGIRRSHPPKFC